MEVYRGAHGLPGDCFWLVRCLLAVHWFGDKYHCRHYKRQLPGFIELHRPFRWDSLRPVAYVGRYAYRSNGGIRLVCLETPDWWSLAMLPPVGGLPMCLPCIYAINNGNGNVFEAESSKCVTDKR